MRILPVFRKSFIGRQPSGISVEAQEFLPAVIVISIAVMLELTVRRSTFAVLPEVAVLPEFMVLAESGVLAVLMMLAESGVLTKSMVFSKSAVFAKFVVLAEFRVFSVFMVLPESMLQMAVIVVAVGIAVGIIIGVVPVIPCPCGSIMGTAGHQQHNRCQHKE